LIVNAFWERDVMPVRLSLTRRAVCWFALAVLACSGPVAAAPAFSELVIFGDSLSDRRNLESLTLGLAPNPPYSAGRFSNGPLWVERLSGLLDLGTVTASRDGGNDFAYGGVASGDGTTNFALFFNAPNVGQQVLNWTATHNASASQLFTVLGGGNDFLAVLDSGGAATAQSVADNIATAVQRLYNDGARHVLVGNLPDFGRIPRYRGTADQSQATALTAAFASALEAELGLLETTNPGLTLYRLDLLTFFDSILGDPSAYGLTNVTDAAYDGDYFGSGTVVSDPSGYAFWDDIHPTTGAHMLIGDRALDSIPEPGGMLACGAFAMLGLLPRRNRRTASNAA
jgi:phospholipase/lecithinase/hemolysin